LCGFARPISRARQTTIGRRKVDRLPSFFFVVWAAHHRAPLASPCQRANPMAAGGPEREERAMFARINHMAMVSPIYPMLANFYEAFFGLNRSGKTSRPLNAVTVGDGNVGLNLNPLRDGYVGGLDHFGLVVDDIESVLTR